MIVIMPNVWNNNLLTVLRSGQRLMVDRNYFDKDVYNNELCRSAQDGRNIDRRDDVRQSRL